MKQMLAIIAAAVILAPVMAHAQNTSNNHPGWNIGQGNPHGSAPAPIIGAGLPMLALGGLVYRLIRRRKKDDL